MPNKRKEKEEEKAATESTICCCYSTMLSLVSLCSQCAKVSRQYIHLVPCGSLRGEGDSEVSVSLLAYIVRHTLSVCCHVDLQVSITCIAGIHCKISCMSSVMGPLMYTPCPTEHHHSGHILIIISHIMSVICHNLAIITQT